MLGQIFLLAIVMLAGLSAALIGGIMLAVGDAAGTGGLLLGLGVPLAVVCLVKIVALNRRYQDEARAAVLADPAEIVARWGEGDDERILAERGLFIGRDFLPFNAAYQALASARLIDDHTLELEFTNIGADGSLRRVVQVPPAALPAVRGFVARRGG